MSALASHSPSNKSVRPRGRLLTLCGALLALAVVSVAAKYQGPSVPRFAPLNFSNAKAAPAPKPKIVGKVTSLEGKVTITRNGVTRPLTGGDQVQVGDTLTTGPRGFVNIQAGHGNTWGVTFAKKSKIEVGQSAYDTTHPVEGPTTIWDVLEGGCEWVSGHIGNDKNNQVETPVDSIGIRGTKFITRYNAKTHTTDIELISGSVAVKPKRSGTARTFTAPVRIRCTATSVKGSPLTQRQYEATRAALFSP